MRKSLMAAVAVLVAVCALMLPDAPARAETLVGSNVDSRVLIGVNSEPSAVQSLMPEGWTSVPFPQGPLKGANFLIVLIDREAEFGPDGKPSFPFSMRAAAFAALGREMGGEAVRLYMLRIHTTNPESDPYGVAKPAEVGRELRRSGSAIAGRDVSDDWSILPSGGGEMRFSLRYKTGTRSFAPGEALPYSTVNKEFFRVYRYQQMVDLVMSDAVGKPISGEFQLTSSVPEFSEIFDGTEKTVAILDVPVYVREVYLP